MIPYNIMKAKFLQYTLIHNNKMEKRIRRNEDIHKEMFLSEKI